MSGPAGQPGGACRASQPGAPPDSLLSRAAARPAPFTRWPRPFVPTRRDVRRWVGTRLPGARFYGSQAGECRCLNCWQPGAVLDFQSFQPRLWCAWCGWFGLLATQLVECGWPTGPLGDVGGF